MSPRISSSFVIPRWTGLLRILRVGISGTLNIYSSPAVTKEIHFRTLGTDEPHPLAARELVVDPILKYTPSLQVKGDLLGLSTPGRPITVTSIWNWKLGIKVMVCNHTAYELGFQLTPSLFTKHFEPNEVR